MVKVKTLEDLAKRNDLKILMRHDSSLVDFAKEGDSELARKINDKLELYFDFHRENIVNNLTNGLIEGSIAYIQEYLAAVIFFPVMTKLNKLFLMENLHISTESAGYEPYFILVNPDISIWASIYLDKTYVFFTTQRGVYNLVPPVIAPTLKSREPTPRASC